MSRSIWLVLALCSAALAVPGGAQAQLLPVPVSCGSSTGAPPADTAGTTNFDVRQADPLAAPTPSKDTYKAALQSAYTKLVTDYGWAPPPTADRIIVVIDDAPARTVPTGNAGDNPNTSWNDQDARSACIVLPDSFGSGDAGVKRLQGTAAHHVAELLLHGIGALTGPNAPDPAIAQGALAVVEDEVVPEADTELDALYPAFNDSLGVYDGAARTQFLALRALTERFGGRLKSGGAEQVLQDFFELTSKGDPGNLTSLDAVLSSRGASLGVAFHDYAVAAQSMRACGAADPLPRCFAEAAKYLAAEGAAPAPHQTISSPTGTLQAEIEDNYAAQFVALPPSSGRFDLEVTNLSTGGALRATAICTAGQQLLRLPLSGPLGAGAKAGLQAFPPQGCTNPALVLTSGTHQVANPSTNSTRPYRVALSAPTATLTVKVAGGGTGGVISDPAGIACGADCEERLPIGSKIKLGALTFGDTVFTGWSGGPCDGSAELTCEVEITDALEVTASFGVKPPQPTPTPGPGVIATPPPNLPSQTPGGSSQTNSDRTAPVVRLDRLKRSRDKRKLTLRVTCPAAETNGCTGFITLAARAARKNLKFGEQAFVSLEAGRSETLTYSLSRRSRDALQKVRRVTVKATGRARDGAFNQASVKKSFVLKLSR